MISRTEDASRRLGAGTVATAVLAFLTRDERNLFQVEWSNAGHIPPVFATAAGIIVPFEHDALIGLGRDIDRHDLRRPLDPGDTMVMVTDGLIETRGETLDVGLDRLRSHIGRDLADLVDGLMFDLAPVDRQDDVAIIAVRPL